MKPPTVFLGEMTDPEVERLPARRSQTVIVPTGSTEQHGPHGPLLTDVLVPNEVARRVAPRGRRASSAPPINYGLSYPHVGLHRASSTSGSRRSWRSSRTCAPSLASIGLPADRVPQRPLRQHVRHRLRLRQRRRPPARRHARLPDQLLGRHDRRGGRRVLRPDDGPPREQGRDLGRHGHRPGLVDLDAANAELPPFPEVTNPAPVHTAFFFSAPGLGPPRDAQSARGATRASRRPSTASATSRS